MKYHVVAHIAWGSAGAFEEILYVGAYQLSELDKADKKAIEEVEDEGPL